MRERFSCLRPAPLQTDNSGRAHPRPHDAPSDPKIVGSSARENRASGACGHASRDPSILRRSHGRTSTNAQRSERPSRGGHP